MIVEGQVHGGLAQGIGQALLEGAIYDANGQLVTASFMDYTMPRADDLPSFKLSTPRRRARAIRSASRAAARPARSARPPAVINAITDAIGNNNLEMPATPGPGVARDPRGLRGAASMYQTTYHRASSVDEAAALFAKGTEAKFLAGGQTLLPVMKQRLAAPSDVIDLGKIKELQRHRGLGRRADHQGRARRYFDVAQNADVKKAIPALAHLASVIGDPAVRYRGTIGGSIANNDPAADYPAALLALGATVKTNKRVDRGGRLLQGPVHDGAGGRRDHHRGVVPGSGEGGLRQVPRTRPRASR